MRDFIGQRRLLERLAERALSGSLSHAYVLAGPRSVGKRTLAIRLAQTLACAKRTAGGCGTCSVCTRIESWSHPDVQLLTRKVDQEAEPGKEPPADAKNIAIEQMREFQRDVALRPLEMSYRVTVIDDAAELSDAAHVALLKTLEEAPKHAILLLITPTPSAMLPTTLSRVQTLRLDLVRAEEIAAGIAHLGKDAAPYAAAAGGRPGVAIRLATDAAEWQQRTDIDREFFRLVSSGHTVRFQWAADLSDGRDRQKVTRAIDARLGQWSELLRDAAVAAAGGTAIRRGDRASESRMLGTARPARELVDAAMLMARMHEDLLVNANLRGMLELLALRLPHAAVMAGVK
ncbi:MAG: hypothetical protein FJ034_08340 [Chloroflexi bacterium]|nr:hypothetical protein [Chloroflexota bacterium]